MLSPDGRALLVELLRPPPGTELVRGIATTFTLDLASALAAPLSFATHRLAANKPLRDLALGLPSWAVQSLPAERMDRIRRLADSVRYAVRERPDDVGEIIFHAPGVTRRRSWKLPHS